MELVFRFLEYLTSANNLFQFVAISILDAKKSNIFMTFESTIIKYFLPMFVVLVQPSQVRLHM